MSGRTARIDVRVKRIYIADRNKTSVCIELRLKPGWFGRFDSTEKPELRP